MLTCLTLLTDFKHSNTNVTNLNIVIDNVLLLLPVRMGSQLVINKTRFCLTYSILISICLPPHSICHSWKTNLEYCWNVASITFSLAVLSFRRQLEIKRYLSTYSTRKNHTQIIWDFFEDKRFCIFYITVTYPHQIMELNLVEWFHFISSIDRERMFLYHPHVPLNQHNSM